MTLYDGSDDVEVRRTLDEFEVEVGGQSMILEPEQVAELRRELKREHDAWKREGMGDRLLTAAEKVAAIDEVGAVYAGIETDPESEMCEPELRIEPEGVTDPLPDDEDAREENWRLRGECRQAVKDVFGASVDGISFGCYTDSIMFGGSWFEVIHALGDTE